MSFLSDGRTNQFEASVLLVFLHFHSSISVINSPPAPFRLSSRYHVCSCCRLIWIAHNEKNPQNFSYRFQPLCTTLCTTEPATKNATEKGELLPLSFLAWTGVHPQATGARNDRGDGLIALHNVSTRGAIWHCGDAKYNNLQTVQGTNGAQRESRKQRFSKCFADIYIWYSKRTRLNPSPLMNEFRSSKTLVYHRILFTSWLQALGYIPLICM